MNVDKAEFVTAGTKMGHYPNEGLPEIAFGGRSNVGKSSLMNNLMARKRLVKVSGRPGKTQTINFFNVNDELSFVDLPGYGYAKVPQKTKARWGKMIEEYLTKRDTLLGVVVIMDLRRGIQDDDMMLIEAAPLMGWQPILVFTKSDKFKKNARIKRRREIADELGIKPSDILLYSAVTGRGRDELWDRIIQLTGLNDELTFEEVEQAEEALALAEAEAELAKGEEE